MSEIEKFKTKVSKLAYKVVNAEELARQISNDFFELYSDFLKINEKFKVGE